MSDKRVHPRVPLSAPVRYLLDDGTAVEGNAHDISLGGMFVEAAAAPSFGVQITIEMTLPGDKVLSKLPAVVRWTKPGGFGVQFGLLGARETHQIAQLIRR